MNNKIKTLTCVLLSCFSFAQADLAYDGFAEEECGEMTCCEHSYDNTYPVEFDSRLCGGYRYATLGMGPFILIPNVGIGYRERYYRHGWDVGASFSTIGYYHQITAHWARHLYLSPYTQNSGYLGLGVLGSGIVSNRGKGALTLAPVFVFGKELESSDESHHFVEMQVGIPTLWFESGHSKFNYIPFLYFKYGFSF